MTENRARTISFGPFDADLRDGVLYRSGDRIRLQKQPFGVLAILLERPGQVITREELRQRIWAAGTFVDFERGLNKAIRRIREALGDSAEKPQFIETVTGRGYRFIATVERKVVSLAISPFENLSGDPNQQYWAEGITDELITQVAGIMNLRVISRASAMRFKISSAALAEIARELGIDLLLQGSVVVSEWRVRIRVQLFDPFRDQHLWAESFEREVGDILTLQVQIAQWIADQVRIQLKSAERAVSPGTRRVNPGAYEAYLKGRFFLTRGTGVEKSLDYFARAIALDPDYAEAHAGLADCYGLLGVLYLRPPREVFPKARRFAEMALERNNRIAEAHKSLAAVLNLYDWNWADSESEFRRALELNPSLTEAHVGYAVLLSCLRRFEEAIREALKARELDPLSPGVNAMVGFIRMRARQYGQAIEDCRQATELDPNNPLAHWLLARSLDAANQIEEALAESQAAARLSESRAPYVGHLGYALARVGDRPGAREVLQDLRNRQEKEYVSPYDFARIYLALGETDLGFESLDLACQERTPRLTGELWERPFDQVRSDPRFLDLIRRIGLPG